VSPPHPPVSEPPEAILERSPRFSWRSTLGRGASAKVFRVFDRERNEDVALKLLHAPSAASLRALHQELALMQGVSHPSLLSLYEVGTLDDHGFLCMELVEGPDLRSYLRQSDAPGFDVTRVARVIALLAGALSVLHGRFLVHRDVKPSNVRVRGDGTPVLLDYGLLTHMAHADGSQMGVGTPAYMSPEQMHGQTVEAASDLYSLGVVLHELLTGHLPPAASARWNEARTTANPPLDERPDIPASIADLCKRLLSAKPELRPVPRQIVTALGLDDLHAGTRLAPPLTFPRMFVARDAELERIDRAGVRAEAKGHRVHIEGAIQSGKSALLAHAVEVLGARHPDALVLRGSFTTHRGNPYGALEDVVRSLSDHLIRHPKALVGLAIERAAWAREVLPVLGSVSALALAHSRASVPDLRERRLRAFAFVSDLLGHLARERMVIVALDDVDAAQRDAQELLEVLTRSTQPGVFWITTSNTPSSSKGGSSELIALPPLSIAELSTLCDRVFEHAGVAPSSRDELPRLAQTPSALLSLIADRLQGGRAQSLEEAYDARIAELTLEAREMLHLLCSIESAPTRDELFLACSLSVERRVESLAHLRNAGLVEEHKQDDGNTRIHVASQRLRERVASALPATARAELAKAWVHAFAGQGPSAAYERLLCHQRAGDLERAADSARMLAERADAVLAFGQAATLKRMLVELGSRASDDARRRDFRALGDTLVLDGRPLEAAEAYVHAADGANSAERLDLNRRRATLLLRSGAVAAGTDAIKDVLGSLGLSLPSSSKRALFSLLWWRAKLAVRGLHFQAKATAQVSQLDLMRIDALLSMANVLGLVDAFRGSELQTRALFMALRAGEARHLARALVQEANGTATFEPPPLKKTNALLATAEGLLAHTDDAYSIALLTMTRGLIAFYEFRPGEARTLLQEAEQLFCDECSDVEWELGNTRQFLLQTLQFQEAYAELRVRTEEHVREAQARGDHYVVTNLTMLGKTFVHLLDGDSDGALEGVERVMTVWNTTGEFYLQHFFELFARTSIATHARSRASLDFLRAARPRLERSLLLKSALVRNTVEFSLSQSILTAVAHGPVDPSEREQLLKECTAIAKRMQKERYPMMALMATAIESSIAFARGELDVALSLGDRAIAQGQSLGIPGQQWRYVIACVRGDTEQARGLAEAMRREGVRDPHRFSFSQVPTALPYAKLDPQ